MKLSDFRGVRPYPPWMSRFDSLSDFRRRVKPRVDEELDGIKEAGMQFLYLEYHGKAKGVVMFPTLTVYVAGEVEL